MRRLFWIVLALLPCVAAADNSRDHLEASTVVTGWVEVAPDGSVYNYTLDQPEKLDAGVVSLIAKTIATWKFKPVLVDDKPVLAKAKMNLRVVASPCDKDEYEIRVRGATFSNGGAKDEEKDNGTNAEPSYKARKPPLYPIMAIRAQTSGTAYLALEVDHTGHVEQAIATQVNLRAIGSEREMRLLRQALADASVAAAKTWTFNVPQSGGFANKHEWTIIIPIDFSLSGADKSQEAKKYGQWDVYIPGPIQPIPWEQDQIAGGNNADAVADDGSVFVPDNRFVLLTPPSPG